jgi:hypothetical protein
MVGVVAGPGEALHKSVVGIAQELGELAKNDLRFERAAELATELKGEVARAMTPAEAVPAGRSTPPRERRRVNRRSRRPAQDQVATVEAFQQEYAALVALIQHADGDTGQASARRVLDLRLDERTRRVFEDAGLHQVHDIASLAAEQAMAIPQLAPSTLAELRAAIMFASEIAAGPKQRMLPPASDDADLFQGLVTGVDELPRRERETVVLRTGTAERVHTIDEVALTLGVPAEQVPILERHALNLLLSQPASMDACWRLEALCSQFGLGWDDERLPTVVSSLYPGTQANFTRLVAWLMREKGRLVAEAAGRDFVVPQGVAHFDEMVIAAIGRYGDMAPDQFNLQLQAALPAADRAMYPEIRASDRVQILGPAVQRDDGMFCLPETPIPDVDDRHIRAINGLIGALQTLGTARISSLTTEVNRRLPHNYHINEQYVRNWLTRHPELFVQSDADRFKLASLDVDILCGLAKSWTPGSTAPGVAVSLDRFGGLGAEKQHERIAKEIADFLGREGPQPMWRIRSYLYGRVMGPADTVIAEYPHQFVRDKQGMVALRDDGDPLGAVFDVTMPTSGVPRRSPAWPQRPTPM